MRDIATATLSGNLTSEVELGELPSGADVARRRVASTTGGETAWVDQTNYFTVEVYGARAGLRRAPRQRLARRGRRRARLAQVDRPAGNQRQVVVLRARQVLFEGRRAGEPNRDEPRADGQAQSREEPTETTAAGEGPAGADDLPF